jgi:MerR family transcriptional regulator/heat shock protein HspR
MSIYRVFYHDDGEAMPLSQIDIHPEFLQLLAELGIIEIRDHRIAADHLQKMTRIMRIRQRLRVNVNAAAIIVDLLERIESLEDEIESLKKMR